MLFIVALTLCIAGVAQAGVLTDEVKTKMMENSKACVAETGIDFAAVKEAAAGNLPLNNSKFPTYLVCFNKKSGIQDANGKLQPATLKPYLKALAKDDAKLTKVLTECFQDKNTPEESAVSLIKCLKADVLPSGNILDM